MTLFRDHEVVALVGSRNRDCRADVEAVVAALPEGTVIVSGGARGVDTWAADAARARGLEVIEYKPKITHGMEQREIVAELMARNTDIARECDRVIAWPHTEAHEKQSGGTYDTIKKARRMGKPVEIR